MPRELRIVGNNGANDNRTYKVLLPEEKFKHFRRVTGSVLRSASETWADLWKEFQGKVVQGVVVLPEASEGFVPECGWEEFLEKMWLLKHYLDYAAEYCEE